MINGVWLKEQSIGNHGFLLLLLGFLADFSDQFWDDDEIRLPLEGFPVHVDPGFITATDVRAFFEKT